MKKKIMILGASLLQVPAIKKAKEMGLYVISIDIDRNAIGFDYADKNYIISTTDTKKVLEVALKEKIDSIITIASDRPMLTVAKVAEIMNLNAIDFETALNATDKYRMRNSLKESNVPIPKFYRIKRKIECMKLVSMLQGNYIIKPADNSGSRGIVLLQDINNILEVEEAYSYAQKYSNSGDVLIEEYMTGVEVSVESLTYKGKTNVIAITDKNTTGSPNFVEIGHSQPSKLPEIIQNEVKKITKEAIKAIGINNGPSHTEIIVTKEGPKIVEIGARLGGDSITTFLTPLSTDNDMVGNAILISLGKEPIISEKSKIGCAIKFIELDTGVVSEISGINEAKASNGVKEVFIDIKVGDSINKVKNSSDRIGYVIAIGESSDDANKNCINAINKISIVVKKK